MSLRLYVNIGQFLVHYFHSSYTYLLNFFVHFTWRWYIFGVVVWKGVYYVHIDFPCLLVSLCLLSSSEFYLDKKCVVIFHSTHSCRLCSNIWSFVWFLQAVKKGDTIFIGQYLFTGNETTSVWLEVREC